MKYNAMIKRLQRRGLTEENIARVVAAREKKAAENLAREAVYLGIACQLFKTNPSAIIGPKEYEVGDVSESFDTSFTKSSDTWCDLYDSALNDLISSTEGVHGIKSFDRSGARVKYGYYGPQ